MVLKEIQDNIARDVHEPIKHVCLKLVEKLSSMRPAQLQRLTFMLLADFAEKQFDDDQLQAALTALTTIKHNPLTLYFVFYDEGEDREIAISASEAMQSVDEDVFIHPRTGEEVEDFARQLKPVYKVSQEFAAAIAGQDGH